MVRVELQLPDGSISPTMMHVLPSAGDLLDRYGQVYRVLAVRHRCPEPGDDWSILLELVLSCYSPRILPESA